MELRRKIRLSRCRRGRVDKMCMITITTRRGSTFTIDNFTKRFPRLFNTAENDAIFLFIIFGLGYFFFFKFFLKSIYNIHHHEHNICCFDMRTASGLLPSLFKRRLTVNKQTRVYMCTHARARASVRVLLFLFKRARNTYFTFM